MTELTLNAKAQTAKGPLRVHRSPKSDVFVKIWDNETEDGKHYYTTSVGRTYRDPETGQPRDTNRLTQTEVNKLPGLINEANQTLRLLNDPRVTRDQALQADQRAQNLKHASENGLKAQRDAVLAKAKTPTLRAEQSSPSQEPDMTP